MPKNPEDPYYYHIYSNTLPPEQAYRLHDELKKNLRAENMQQTQVKGY